MTDLTTTANRIAARGERMAVVMASIERHLELEQADAIMAPAESASAPRNTRQPDPQPGEDGYDPEAGPAVDLGHADPTPLMASRLAWYTRQRKTLLTAMRSLDKAYDHLELVCRAVVDVKPTHVAAEPTCPGWTVELRARLGGCGNHLEHYHRADKTIGLRDLCAGCRKAKQRADRDEERGVA